METNQTPPHVVHLPASLGLRDAEQVQKLLLDALACHTLALDIPPNATADLSFLQLVESARLYAELLGKRLSLQAPAGGAIRRLLQEGGFLTSMSPQSARFWLHEEIQQ